MAGGSLYHDDDEGGGAITDINVTPFVDVVLVLLVVFIVTAKLIVARGVEIDKPKAATGGEVQSTLRVSVNAGGELFVNGDKYPDDTGALARIKQIAATTSKPKAIIAGDRKSAYGGVMRAIDLVQQAGVTAIALENERP
ncbi:MAG TPA: biopolymer transporter ExbD [Kofleriaceae bacterium]|jgi:biopolymer transport protein ExbD|nr:biopolymer transporter ExbD [Kofleriaceae bacterium]